MSIILIYIIIIAILTLSQFPKTNYYSRLNQYLNLKAIHPLCDSLHHNPEMEILIDRLYDVCQFYSNSDPLLIESSIKISRHHINPHRLTIPLALNHLIHERSSRLRYFCSDICQLFNLKNVSEKLADYIELCVSQDQLNSRECDLIVGFDWLEHKLKIYLDQSEMGLQCLEMDLKTSNLRQRFYQILSNNNYRAGILRRDCSQSCLWILKCLGMLPGNVDHIVIYQVGKDIYHCVLKTPQILRKFEIQELEKYFGLNLIDYGHNYSLKHWYSKSNPDRYRISVISVEFKDQELQSLSLYLRPNHLLVQVAKYHQVIPNLLKI